MSNDPWRVTMSRVSDGYVIHLHLGDVMVILPALEAHKLGSALHAAIGLDDPNDVIPWSGPIPEAIRAGIERHATADDHHGFAQIAHYYSTACLHLTHGACRRTCKFCDDRCRCDCHADQDEAP